MGLAKTIVAAALGISMAATPLLAQSAAPLSVAGSVDRAGASTDGASQLNRESMIGLALIAIMAAIIILSKTGDGPDSP